MTETGRSLPLNHNGWGLRRVGGFHRGFPLACPRLINEIADGGGVYRLPGRSRLQKEQAG